MAEEKQALLLNLLAGRDKVQTFLALLNQQAVASGVQIQRYEPLKTPPPPQGQSRRNNNRSNGTQEAEQPQDLLQALGYRKSSVALEVSGPFWGLQTFLQRMEALELWVESSDLEVKASAPRDADREAKAPPESRTELTLQLSFYDPLKDDVDFGNSREQPPNEVWLLLVWVDTICLMSFESDNGSGELIFSRFASPSHFGRSQLFDRRHGCCAGSCTCRGSNQGRNEVASFWRSSRSCRLGSWQ